MKKLGIIIVLLGAWFQIFSQSDSSKQKIEFISDFRFRVEHDWNSRKSDGSFRNDRSRLRYRLRSELKYIGDWYTTGFRIRTGNPIKQQDPQLTLGADAGEFNVLALGFDKVYFNAKWDSFGFEIGKNPFVFKKSNELFWSDNVSPEGVSIWKSFQFKSNIINSIKVHGGHFILATNNRTFDRDAYLQAAQLLVSSKNKRIEVFPSFYYFNSIDYIPDGYKSFQINYSIAHLGFKAKPFKTLPISIEGDYYQNLEDYSQNDSISNEFKNQSTGMVVGLKYGDLKEKGSWQYKVTLANLERFAALDYMTQNDWARWDYSSYNSPDGRLTNFKGVELVTSYKVDKKVKLTVKYYVVEQLIPMGNFTETGNRIRFDIDVKF